MSQSIDSHPRFLFLGKVSHSSLQLFSLSLLLLLATFHALSIPNVYAPPPPDIFIVPTDYPTIQSAIDVAGKGDIIKVLPGTYNENLMVTPQRAGLKIIGEDKATTIIDGSGTGTPITLAENSITITGFTIRDQGTRNNGITTELFGGHNISNNIIENNLDGIYFLESSSNIISGNTFFNNSMHAINLGDSLNNQISDNIISEGAFGIYLSYSSSTTVVRNNISNTGFGIYSLWATQNTISNNTVQSSSCGIITSNSDHLYINNNAVSGGGYGMYGIQLQRTRDSQLANNTLTQASYGIYLAHCNYNILGGTRGNLVAKNHWGLTMYNSTGNNIIDGNTFGENTWGIYITAQSSGNTIYHNNFVGNVRQAYQDIGLINTWRNPQSEGNYWSDYTGYPPAGGVDYWPLAEPWPMRNIAITSVTASTTLIYPGDPVTIDVTVQNFGVIVESVKVSAYYDSTVIGTKTTILAPSASRTFTFNWDTINVQAGDYIISAVAEPLPYIERNYADNYLTDGTIQVGILGDINGDHQVDDQDLILLDQAYGSTTTNGGNWNPNADLNKDNIIDAIDLILLSKNYCKTA